MLRLGTRFDPALRARFFRGLADPAPLVILETLRKGEQTAGDIAVAADVSPSAASRHLACLRECGLVEARQAWRHVYYRLADYDVEHLLTEADLVLDVIAERIAACQRPERKDSRGGHRRGAGDRSG